MKEPLLKYRLEKLDRSILFQVLEQDESQVYKGEGVSLSYKCTNGVTIYSSSVPDITYAGQLKIYLRGSDPKYYLVPSLTKFGNNEARDIAYSKITEGLAEWAQGGGFYKKADSTKKSSEENIFTLY